MNKPEPHELFVLDEGEKKISYAKDTKVPNAGTFVVKKEDHTVGNLVRMQLLRDPDVLFAGYKVPHPLKHEVVVKIQTTHSSAPVPSMLSALNDLLSEITLLEERFNNECQRKQQEQGGYI